MTRVRAVPQDSRLQPGSRVQQARAHAHRPRQLWPLVPEVGGLAPRGCRHRRQGPGLCCPLSSCLFSTADLFCKHTNSFQRTTSNSNTSFHTLRAFVFANTQTHSNAPPQTQPHPFTPSGPVRQLLDVRVDRCPRVPLGHPHRPAPCPLRAGDGGTRLRNLLTHFVLCVKIERVLWM